MATDPDQPDDLGPLFCARCTAELQPGRGDFYQVTIEAVADPTGPLVPDEPAQDLRKRIQKLIAAMEGVSEREALDQVYRRLVFHLCGRCYRHWIENPTG